MLITKEITIDLLHRGVTEPLEAVQCDANTRAVKVTLLNGGESWTPPSGAAASVAYKKPDGTFGWYDELPDRTTACSITGNTVTAVFAPQMLTAAGKVQAAVIFQDSRLNQLATFVFAVEVQANPAAGKNISNDYYKYSTMEQLSAAVDAWLTETEVEKNDFLSKADGALEAMRDAITASDSAPPIVCEESGAIISVSDSSGRLLHGLTLYGKTTQSGTPTPTSPVELVSAGASGAISATVVGKNLYSMAIGSSHAKPQSINIPAGESFTVAVHSAGGNQQYNCGIYYADGTSYHTGLLARGYSTITWSSKALTAEKNIKGICFYSVHDADYTTRQVDKVLVCLGNVDTVSDADYEEFTGQTLTVSTPNGLPGIPVSSGGNYTDENGQQWLCDEVDFARGVYVQRVKTLTYDGDEAWVHYTTNDEWYHTFEITVTGLRFNTNYAYGMCNQMQFSPRKDINSTINNVIALTSNGNVIDIVRPNGITSLEEWKTHLQANPLVVSHVLTTPIETALSAEEMAAYYALHSNKPNTTAFNDAGAGMKIAYVADTKLYFDNKFGELAAALVHNT